jgi:UDP-N-acetylmuramate--alanine ligase
MTNSEYKHIYLVGIGGISVSAIAKLLKHHNIKVSGFDVEQSEITDELIQMGIEISINEPSAQLPHDVDLVVYSEAVPKTDRLRQQAKSRNIKQIRASRFWGQYSKDKKVIAISGTNGKSTTTAMVGLMLENAGYDPTVVVGTRVLEWDANIRIGKSEWLVIEADEYEAKMLEYTPHIAVITNISADHLDFYKGLGDIIAHFQQWISMVPRNGVVILNQDDPNSQKLNSSAEIRKFSVGGDTHIRAVGRTVVFDPKTQTGLNAFNIADDEKDWGYAELRIPGEHNVANAVAAAAAASAAGVKHKHSISALNKFKGTWRRFEVLGTYNGALVISDYAHHPNGIKATLEAARTFYPFKKIKVLFQPHHHNRTKNLFNEFVKSFGDADELIISEIYDVSGREMSDDQEVSSKDLVEAIKREGRKNASYAENLESAETMLKESIKPEDIIIIMGAGDVDAVSRSLVNT